MTRRLRALVAACAAAALLTYGGRWEPASAQSADTGIIRIAVRSAFGAVPLADARVFLLGPSVASALTNRSGIVRYTDVATGLYRVRVNKPGYRTSMSAQFELLGDKEVDVDVALGPLQGLSSASSAPSAEQNGPAIIGRVQAKVTLTTRDIGDDSPVRRISDSLADALDTLAGVDVTTGSNDPDAAQTISLHGHDESQTAVTLDGIPLSAPGTAVDLRGLDTDLFSGASVSFGARAGALGGGVNFTTLQPTQTWQTRFAAAEGSFDRYTWSLGETGSIGKLGIAVLSTKRGGNNPLTFQDYLDESGQTYPHGGEQTNAGELVKLRYALTDDTNLIFTGLESHRAIASLCTQFTGPLPCGIGPNATSTGTFAFGYGTVQSLIGQVALTVTGYVSSHATFSDELGRTIDACVGTGVPCPQAAPFATDTTSVARGLAAQATISKDNHTITFNASTFGALTTFVPLVATGPSALVTGATNGVSAATYQLADSIKLGNTLSLGPTLSLAATTGAGTSVLGGLRGTWQPSRADTFRLSASLGSSQPAPTIARTYSDPQSARVNCFGGSAQISGPGDAPTAQSAIDYEASWTHQWAHGNLTFDLYRQTQAGQLVDASVTASAAGLPPDVASAVDAYYATVCPLSAPAAIYVAQPVNDTTRIYQGFDVTGRVALGRDVTAIPSYSSNAAFYAAADPRFTGPGSTLLLGSQIYGRPVHKGNLTLDAYHPPSGLEFLANAQYVGVNNMQHIAPYVSVSFGVTHPFGIGRLTLFETNAFGTQSGLFSTVAGAYPQPLVGGGALVTAGNPLPPRTIQLTYSIDTGARSGAGFARPASGREAAAARPSPPPFGFGQLHFIAPAPGADPLSVATSRPECIPTLRPLAQTLLEELGAASAAFVAGQTPLPTVRGIAVTPHGDPHGVWYFALGPEIPPGLFPRRPAAGGEFARSGPGGPNRGPGGGPPSGFRPRIEVGPQSFPRPAFTPSPALLAALQPFRALVSCSYGTVLTPDTAKARGFDVPSPGAPLSPQPRPSAGASPSPAGPRRRGFLQYAPSVGIFVVRPPDLGTGGGSVKQ